MLASLAEGVLDQGAIDTLVAGVLDAPAVRLALAVQQGGPFRVRRAIELAERVLDAAEGGVSEGQTG